LNGIYMRDSTDDELFRSARDIAHEIENGADLADRFAQIGWDRFAATVPSLKERSKTLVDLLNGARFLIAERPLSVEPKAAKHLDQAATAHLAELAKDLATIDNWTVEAVETAIRAYAEGADLKLGKIAQPLRVALTGSTISPPIFDLLAVLGKAETLARIADQAVAA
ncbi:MAG: glutamate--tRNA ligase, partial [Pseudomonadota bacterium]